METCVMKGAEPVDKKKAYKKLFHSLTCWPPPFGFKASKFLVRMNL
jgi:hypothetical protein